MIALPFRKPNIWKLNRKILALIIAIALVVAVMLSCTTNPITGSAIVGDPTADDSEVRIGVSMFFTHNDYTYIASAFREGVDLAVEEINTQGGVLGKPLRIIYEDDQLNSATAATVASKLTEVDKVHAVLVGVVNIVKAEAPIFDRAQIPALLVWDAKVPGIGLDHYPHLFSAGYSTIGAGEVLATYAVESLGAKRIAVLSHPDEWSNIISRAFIEKAKEQGGIVTLDEQLDLTETDFKTIILKVQDADAIYAPLISNIDVFLRRARELGYTGILLSGDVITEESVVNAGPAAEGIYFTQVWAPENPKMMALLEAYKRKYGKETDLAPFVGLAYDNVYLITDAITRAGSTNGNAISHALAQTEDFQGAMGPITIDSFGSSTRFERVFTVKGGRMRLAE